MSLLKISRMGHPILRRPADPVADPHDPELRRLVGDMIETMRDAGGVGLAAPQIHVGRRIIVFEIPEFRQGEDEPPGPGTVTALVNPSWQPIGEELEAGYEGCLSIPGLRGIVPRYRHIRYRGIVPGGSEIEVEASGFHARVVQHEIDHLDGILYLDRMTDLTSLAFEGELERAAAARPGSAAGEAEGDGEEDRP